MQEQEFIESRVEMEKTLREEDTGYLGLSLGGKALCCASQLSLYGWKNHLSLQLHG